MSICPFHANQAVGKFRDRNGIKPTQNERQPTLDIKGSITCLKEQHSKLERNLHQINVSRSHNT
jgi:hypothetical protein